MAKLVYYYAEREDDGDCYSIIATTLKEARRQVAENSWASYGPIQKKVLEYRNAFDLLEWVSSEGGGRGAGYTVKEYK